MPFKQYSLMNNQIYDCKEYKRFGNIVNSNPSPVKYQNMFLFDIPDGNFIEILSRQKDVTKPNLNVWKKYVHMDENLNCKWNDSGSNVVQYNTFRIYKTGGKNAIIFSIHREIPCIFVVPQIDFSAKHWVFSDTEENCMCSTMTIAEDENQLEIFHAKKMREVHEEFKKCYKKDEISLDTLQIILRIIMPTPNW